MAVFQRNGAWWIGYPLGNGKYRRERVGSSHALAKEVLAKRRAEIAERKFFPARAANVVKFGEFADKFWELHGQNLRGKSWRHLVGVLKGRFGQLSMAGVKPSDIQRYYNEVMHRASAATANRHLSLLRLMFNKAKAWGDFYGDNPCAPVKPMRESPGRLRYLTVEEMERLLAACHPRLFPVVLLAVLTGMRRGEIQRLDWKDVDLKQGHLYLLITKSGRPRELPIGGKLHALLGSLGPRPEGKVFNLPNIMWIRYWERALKAAGIRDFRFHDLRHTFASHFIMRTNNLPALQKLLGHSTPAMTLRYAHLSKGHLASEIAAFESVVPAGSRTAGYAYNAPGSRLRPVDLANRPQA